MLKIGASSVSAIVCMWVRRIGKSGQFYVAWPWTSHKEHVGGGRGYVVVFGIFPPVFVEGGGAVVQIETVIGVPRGG